MLCALSEQPKRAVCFSYEPILLWWIAFLIAPDRQARNSSAVFMTQAEMTVPACLYQSASVKLPQPVCPLVASVYLPLSACLYQHASVSLPSPGCSSCLFPLCLPLSLQLPSSMPLSLTPSFPFSLPPQSLSLLPVYLLLSTCCSLTASLHASCLTSHTPISLSSPLACTPPWPSACPWCLNHSSTRN